MASTSTLSRTANRAMRSTRARMELTFQVARRMASSLRRAGDATRVRERRAAPAEEREIVEGMPRPGLVPVDHAGEPLAVDDPVVRAGVVVADELSCRQRRRSLPPRPRPRIVGADDVVIAAQPGGGILH